LMIYLIGILSFPLVNVKWLDFQAVTLINRLALGEIIKVVSLLDFIRGKEILMWEPIKSAREI